MVNVSWHPNRATCAVSVGRSVYLVDGATGAVLRVARTPLATLALAYAPAKLGARLCALLRDGSLHAVDFEDETRTAADAARSGMNRGGGGGGGAPVRRLHPPTVNVKKRGLAPADRRGLICFGGDAATPWAVFALAGDVTLRAARVNGGDAGDDAPGSPASSSSAPSSPTFSSKSGSSSSHTHHSGGGSSFGSLFGKKRTKHPPLLKIKGEHKKPLACLCSASEPEAVSDEDASLIYAGYADGALFCYDLKTQTCVGSASLPRAVVTRKKGGTYASTDDAADPLGIARTATEKGKSRDDEGRSGATVSQNDPSVDPTKSGSSSGSRRTVDAVVAKEKKKTVRSKTPPPCTAMSVVARRGDVVVVVADVAGRLTSWSARPKPQTPSLETDANVTSISSTHANAQNAHDQTSSSSFGTSRTTHTKPKPKPKQTKPRRVKPGPGGAPVLELLNGVRASKSDAPAFLLSALPDGSGVTAIVGERSFVTGAAFCVLKTFLVNVHDGSFDEVVKVDPRASSPFPPLPPAAHRVALASHPTQIRVAAAAAAVSLIGGDARGGRFVSPLVKTSDAPPFTAFFASGDDAFGGASREEAKKNHALDSCALRDRVEAEHVSTLAAASAQPPPRRARVFYLGDESSVWSVAFAEGPKASRRCRLPPPPSSAERAVPVRLRVAVTAGAPSGTATGNAVATADGANIERKSASSLTRELFLTLWRVPGAKKCASATVVDGATGSVLAQTPSRDATFVFETETNDKSVSFVSLDLAGVSVEVRSMTTPSVVTSTLDLKQCLASENKTVEAYKIFPGPASLSVAVACVADGASVFAACPFSLGNDQKGVATLALRRGERVLDAAWQLVGRGDGASDTTPWGGLAVLTDERLLMCEYALSNFRERKENVPLCALRVRAEVKNLSRSTPIFSFLWVGPALLFSHHDGVSVLGWDGKVSTAFVRGAGGGNELVLSAATEDAILLFLDAAGTDAEERSTDSKRATPFFRPVSVADALVIGWGSLVHAKARDGPNGCSDGLLLVARRAVASSLSRHDASRVSAGAVSHVADTLSLPGLAANVARRATHLSAVERARFMVAARNTKTALETVRNSLFIGAEGHEHGDRGDASYVDKTTPHVPVDDALFRVAFDACEAASAAGDAASAFDAACLAFGASGGENTEALERLLEYGVAAAGPSPSDVDGSLAGDDSGGFKILDALVETTLAPGAARDACASAARRRLRRWNKNKTFRLRPADRAGAERAKAGNEVPLGWSAVPASVSAESVGAPTAETSRVSALTHADALGRRIRGAPSFLGGVEGDREKVERFVRKTGVGAFSSARASGTSFGSGPEWRRPEPLRVPGSEDATRASASPGVTSPPPPPFRAAFASENDASASGDESDEEDPFPWAQEEEEDDDGSPWRADAFHPSGSFAPDKGNRDPFAFESSSPSGFGPSPGGGQGVPWGASFGTLALPEPSADPFGAPPGAPGLGTAPDAMPPRESRDSEVAPSFAAFGEASPPFRASRPDASVTPFAFGDGFASGFGGGDAFEPPSDTSHVSFAPFGTPFGEPNGGDTITKETEPTRTPTVASRSRPTKIVADATGAFDPFAREPIKPTSSNASAFKGDPFTLSADADRDDDREDPFGSVSDEDPFGDVEEEEEEEEEDDPRVARRDDFFETTTTTDRVDPSIDVVARAIVDASPPPVTSPSPLRSRPVHEVNRSHEETLRWALRGMDALDTCDYETCESAFKAATKLAVAGRAPSVRAAVKCRSYAVAARALRFARAVSSTIVKEGNVPKLVGQNLAAAIELARLARHVAALPLDARHRACACRFAAAWHFKLGAFESGSRYLAAAATAAASAARFEGEDGERARVAIASLARCARAMERGAKPGGPFAFADETQSSSEVSADAWEVPGWVCAATLRSLRRNTDAESNPEMKGLAAVECARCRTAHCEAFALGDGAACAVCDQPFRT